MGILRPAGLLVLVLSALGCSSPEQRSEKAFDRGTAAMDRKDYDTAIAEFTEVIRLDPKADGAYHNRAHSYAEKREYAKAIADYTEAIRLNPDEADSYSNLAWLLATCPKAELRDGKRAVELATRACKLSGWQDANDLENLATAYAECGRFEEAVEWQTKAVALGTGLENLDESRQRLELFKSGKPFRDK
jgi:tetratricopeptide (TPR) repeat protein